ncbi:MAG: DUF5615 family PIN-like protein [Verrucomicrobiae bacterium]|nr:DUF5615 family PIN-like protein [Verrucomicrobiae bacterium]
MNLVADENLDRTVIERLREAGHVVWAIVEMAPGISDDDVLSLANREEATLITEDKDFGELAFRRRLIHRGVLLVRLVGLPAMTKASVILEAIAAHESELTGAFAVVSPGQLRIRREEF